MSFHRWVIIDDQSYEQLASKQNCNDHQSAVDTSDTASERTSPATKGVTQRPNTSEHSKEHRNSLEIIGGSNLQYIQKLPITAQPSGLAFLKKLQKVQNLTITTSGVIHINGTSVQDYTLDQLLKAVCVPKATQDIPSKLLQILEKHHIFKPTGSTNRAWKNLYYSKSFKKFILAKRKGHFEGQRHSMSRLKKKTLNM